MLSPSTTFGPYAVTSKIGEAADPDRLTLVHLVKVDESEFVT